MVPQEQAIALPDPVSFEAGACLGIPALTAHRAVHAGGTVNGRQVLVQGGAGGVGSFAVGFARRAGAQVIATVLGGSIAAYATNNPRPAIPFWELLSKTARVSLLASDDFPMDQKLAAAAEVNELLAAGWRGSRVDRIFPLDEIAAAHAYAESHPRGRVLLAL